MRDTPAPCLRACDSHPRPLGKSRVSNGHAGFCGRAHPYPAAARSPPTLSSGPLLDWSFRPLSSSSLVSGTDGPYWSPGYRGIRVVQPWRPPAGLLPGSSVCRAKAAHVDRLQACFRPSFRALSSSSWVRGTEGRPFRYQGVRTVVRGPGRPFANASVCRTKVDSKGSKSCCTVETALHLLMSLRCAALRPSRSPAFSSFRAREGASLLERGIALSTSSPARCRVCGCSGLSVAR
jgi:hypothetical protein